MGKLRDIQMCELEMLKEIDRICRKYKIRYCMAYGTFLGAVRHEGFIPWDDDVDVSMPLEDFYKFESICKRELNPKFFLQTPETDIAPFSFYKIRANKTRMVEDGLRSLNMHHGIWVDIFPYVRASNSEAGRKVQIFCHSSINRIRARYFYKNSKSPLRKLWAAFPRGACNLLDKLCMWILSKLGSPDSGQYFELSRCRTIEDNYFDCRLFDYEADYLFEGLLLRGPTDYDAYLSKCYGKNYMTPVQYSHIKDLDGVVVPEKE